MKSPPKRTIIFLSLALVQLIAVAGDRLKQFSFIGMIGLYAPGSSVELLKLNIFLQLPMLLFTPVVGALIDRSDRSLAIIGACAFRATVLAALPTIFSSTGESLMALYALGFTLSMADLVFAPARSALLPELVPASRLLQANAVFWTIGIVATLAGVLGGGWLFDYRSWQSSFHVGSATYIVAAAVMLPAGLLLGGIGRRPAMPSAGQLRPVRLLADVREIGSAVRHGIVFMREDRRIGVCLSVQAGLFAVGGVGSTIVIARIQEIAPVGSALFLSIVGAALIGGLVVGSGLAAVFRDHASVRRNASVGAMLCGVALAGIGRTETLVPLSIWAAILGLAVSPAFITTETLLQHLSPRQFLGRVFATREAVVKLAFLASAALATAANAMVSKASILVGLGLFLALFGVVLERTRWLEVDLNDEQR